MAISHLTVQIQTNNMVLPILQTWCFHTVYCILGFRDLVSLKQMYISAATVHRSSPQVLVNALCSFLHADGKMCPVCCVL